MFLINFQLWARNGKIPGGGNFNIRGGFNISGKRLHTHTHTDRERERERECVCDVVACALT